MSKQFKAKGQKELCINGYLVKTVWRQFHDETLYTVLRTRKDVSLLVFENGKWVAPDASSTSIDPEKAIEKAEERKEEAIVEAETKKKELEVFLGTATVADLKAKLIDSGYEKKELYDLSKADLTELVVAL